MDEAIQNSIFHFELISPQRLMNEYPKDCAFVILILLMGIMLALIRKLIKNREKIA